jgi:cytochrome c553
MAGSRRFALLVACLAASFPVRAEDQKPETDQPAFTLRLNDLMVATQIRHFKVWYAGLVENWPLANYELGQIRQAIADAKRVYANKGDSKSDMAAMSEPSDELDQAIKAKDIDKFHKAYAKLTAACNTCHEATGFGFIKIREPRLSPMETSPFTDESFSGK